MSVLLAWLALMWPFMPPAHPGGDPHRDRAAYVVHRRHVRELRRERLARRRHHRLMRLLGAARSQLGVPYVWGGESPGWGFDCSGLVQWAYRTVGVHLPRTTWSQRYSGRWAPLDRLKPGDLVFAEGGGHVGIYLGGGRVLNAPHTGAVVSTLPLSWFGADYARRVL